MGFQEWLQALVLSSQNSQVTARSNRKIDKESTCLLAFEVVSTDCVQSKTGASQDIQRVTETRTETLRWLQSSLLRLSGVVE